MSKGIIIWLEFKHNILTPTVLISNELFIKQEGEQSQVLIGADFTCVVVFLCLELVYTCNTFGEKFELKQLFMTSFH